MDITKVIQELKDAGIPKEGIVGAIRQVYGLTKYENFSGDSVLAMCEVEFEMAYEDQMGVPPDAAAREVFNTWAASQDASCWYGHVPSNSLAKEFDELIRPFLEEEETAAKALYERLDEVGIWLV